jgi:hypothetical protein
MQSHELFDIPEERTVPPTVQLGMQEGPRMGGLAIPDEEHAALLRFASWEEGPPFVEGGRSAFVRKRLASIVGGTRVGAYKLKGVGNRDMETGEVSIPVNIPFQGRMMVENEDSDVLAKLVATVPRILIHRGIADDGSFRPVPDPEKPLGGLMSGRGMREFENTRMLHTAGVPACAPITWGRYSELTWHEEPMEWVVLSQPTGDHRRLGNMFEPKMSGVRVVPNTYLREAISKKFDVFDPKQMPTLAIRTIRDIAYKQGQTLRKAHEAGVVRFAGHLGNWSYMPREQQVFMHDFDSSVKVSDLNSNARALSFMRDIESLTVGIMHSLGHSRMLYMVNDERKFRKFSPIGAMIEGYFSDDPDAKGAVKHASNILTKQMIEWLKPMNLTIHPIGQQEWLSKLGFLFAQDLMEVLFDVFPKSELGKVNEIPYGKTQLRRNFSRFEQESTELSRRKLQELREQLPPWARMMLGL